MEMKTEEVKVMHNQHARILKEDDEIWISSEDLNTENSSDDDKSKTKHAFKKKLKLKNRKRSSPNIRLQRPSIPSVPSTSKELDERLLMPNTDDAQYKSTDESRTSDEECHIPPISSECLSKRLSLEDWRPTRGSLTISSLDETTAAATGDARKIANETGNFYKTMLYKLKSLKSCSVLDSARKEKLDVKEKLPVLVADKTFKYLKNTPEVRQKLEFISKLDEEINEAIDKYQTERAERLSTEFDLCKSISEHAGGEERGAESFLQMCNFEERLKKYLEEAVSEGMERMEQAATASGSETRSNVNEEANEESQRVTQSYDILREENNNINFMSAKNFVRKNIYAAKEGVMAGFSLTDEEKTKIADLLKDIDNFQMNEINPTLSESSLTQVDEKTTGETDLNRDVINDFNAFVVPERDRVRMGEIDCQLEKFTEDQEQNEKAKKPIPVIKDEEFWKKYALDQSLKEIDAKLERLYASYVEDEEKLKQKPHKEEEDQETEDKEENQPDKSAEET